MTSRGAASRVGVRVGVFSILLAAAGLILSPADLQAQQAKFKAIWEPVNYPDDFRLGSVYFANDQVGWIGGTGAGSNGGVILYTADGGEHWDIQLGDPKSNEAGYHHLHFLDATHGWAIQNEKLLRTTDGKNWEDVGSFPKFQPFQSYLFTSPQNGIEIAGYANDSRIFSTKDGGRTWKQSFQCATTLQVQGLTKKVGCHFNDLAFPSASIGYAVGGGYNGGFSVIAKTEDGGDTWRMIFATTDLETVDSVFFTDNNRGIIRLHNNKILATDDGGQSWRGVAATVLGPIKFADPAVGWSCGTRSCSITTDGGQHWTSRDVRLPANIDSFSVPRRDRVFVVGDHGMIYRYRIVPASYAAKGAVDAPLLPAYGGPFNAQLESLKAKVRGLQAKLGDPAGATGPGTAFAQETRFSQGAPAAAQDTSTDGTTGFSQDTGFSQEQLAAPPSAPVRDCCATQVLSLQSELNSFSKQVPAFAQSYRNLNLLFVGMNMLSDLNGRAAGVRSSFLTLKDAQDVPSAAAALQDLMAKLEATSVAVSTGFQTLAANDSAREGGSAVSNMLAPGASPPAGGDQNTVPQTSAQPKESAVPNLEDVSNTLRRFLRR
jgi:photosystem II stability/assembly factor-like uncharacterized protein